MKRTLAILLRNPLSLLGLVLIAIVVLVNALAWALRRAAERLAG